MGKPDYYQVLGVSKIASLPEIKQAHRRLAMKYHPDRYHSADTEERTKAEERFKEVQKAYEVLSDPVKRREYDTGRKSAITDKPRTFLTELWEGIFNQGLVSP